MVRASSSTAAHLDMTVSFYNYAPTTAISDSTAGVYLSYFDMTAGTWGVSQCRGRPDFNFFAPWVCASTVGTAGSDFYVATGWSFAPVIVGSVPHVVASTIRVVNGDLIAAFLEDDRMYLANCPLGLNCHRRSGWNAYAATSLNTDRNASGTPPTASWGYLAGGANQSIYLVYPSRNGAAQRTVNFLSGGSFTAR